jgi:hypothetical protein
VAWPEEAVRVPEPVPIKEAEQDEERGQRTARLQQIVQVAVLAVYAALVAAGIAWHEPWADEAQAWLLARDQGFWHLMLHSLRYEGSPGLWHALLWVLAGAHVGYIGMHWVSGAIAVAGVYVLLRWSPFPLVLKVLLPFGFWLAYQNAVVARSYVLFGVLAFSAAAILRRMAGDRRAGRRDAAKLFWLALILGLMGNLSLHGMVASLGFALVALSILRRKARVGFAVSMTVPVCLLCAFWIFSVATVVPTSDVDFAAGKNLERSTEKIWAAFGNKQAKAELAARQSDANDVRPGELAPVPPVEFHRSAKEALWRKAARVLALLTYPVSNFRWLALAVVALIVLQAAVFRAGDASGQMGWVGLLPWALMVLIFTSIYLAPRHAGMLWVALVAALWLTWPEEGAAVSWKLWVHRITVAALLLIAGDQAWWTAHAVWADIHGPYSGDVAMAKFLRTQAPGKRIAGFYYHSVGPAALLPHSVYFNQPASYWIWSREVRIDQQAPVTIASHPDVIVVGAFDWNPRNGTITDDWIAPNLAELNRIPLNDGYAIIPYAEAHGYRETHRFCGTAFMRQGYSEIECQVALEPVQ